MAAHRSAGYSLWAGVFWSEDLFHFVYSNLLFDCRLLISIELPQPVFSGNFGRFFSACSSSSCNQYGVDCRLLLLLPSKLCFFLILF